MDKKKGLLIVLSGPSGAGKGTVLQHVSRKLDRVEYSISATTRKPRKGEVDGKNYFFVTRKKFKQMIDNGEFLEHQKVYNEYYGTPKKFVSNLRDNGIDVVIEIDVQGAIEVIKNEDCVSIFLTPKDKETLRKRLKKRATESAGEIERRIEWAKNEYEMAKYYDYVIINEDVDVCADNVCAIIKAERHRTRRLSDFLERINTEFKKRGD